MNPFVRFFTAFGEVMVLMGKTVREMVRPPYELRLTIAQLERGGVDSTSITLLTAVFTGMVTASQFAVGLEQFGATAYTGKIVAKGIIRELGPVLTALLVGGRVGAGFTAELGSMAVTEQIDAIRALGADPVRKLVLPRVLAMTLAMPLLTILADIVGCAGGIIITMAQVGLTFTYSVQQMLETLLISDVIHGLVKSVFFGGIIAILACWNGMTVHGGSVAVGRATTDTVVYTSVSILVADFALTQILMQVYH